MQQFSQAKDKQVMPKHRATSFPLSLSATGNSMSNKPEVQYVPHHEDQDGFTPVRTYRPGYFEKKACVSDEEARTQPRGQLETEVIRRAANDGAKKATAPRRSGKNNAAEGISHQPQGVTQHRRRPEQPHHLSTPSLPSIIVTVSQPHHCSGAGLHRRILLSIV